MFLYIVTQYIYTLANKKSETLGEFYLSNIFKMHQIKDLKYFSAVSI